MISMDGASKNAGDMIDNDFDLQEVEAGRYHHRAVRDYRRYGRSLKLLLEVSWRLVKLPTTFGVLDFCSSADGPGWSSRFEVSDRAAVSWCLFPLKLIYLLLKKTLSLSSTDLLIVLVDFLFFLLDRILGPHFLSPRLGLALKTNLTFIY